MESKVFKGLPIFVIVFTEHGGIVKKYAGDARPMQIHAQPTGEKAISAAAEAIFTRSTGTNPAIVAHPQPP